MPLDVIKTRLMTQKKEKKLQGSIVSQIYQDYGVKGFSMGRCSGAAFYLSEESYISAHFRHFEMPSPWNDIHDQLSYFIQCPASNEDSFALMKEN